jgi:hypothetical protein
VDSENSKDRVSTKAGQLQYDDPEADEEGMIDVTPDKEAAK